MNTAKCAACRRLRGRTLLRRGRRIRPWPAPAHANDFLHTDHLVESAGIELSLVAGDADGRALRSGNGMRAKTQRLDLPADAAHLFFGGVRLHDNKHWGPLVAAP